MRGETPTLLGPLQSVNLNHWTGPALSKGPQENRCIRSSPEDGNKASFRNFVFSNFLEYLTIDNILLEYRTIDNILLEYRMIDKAQNLRNSKCHKILRLN
jgi:hypothetical protein